VAQHRSTVGRESEAHPAMLNEPETIAVARISQDLSEIFFKMMGKTPDPEAVQAEAEASWLNMAQPPSLRTFWPEPSLGSRASHQAHAECD
jgi:hypothetical protein